MLLFVTVLAVVVLLWLSLANDMEILWLCVVA